MKEIIVPISTSAKSIDQTRTHPYLGYIIYVYICRSSFTEKYI